MPQVKPSKHIELGVHGVSAASCSTGAVVVEANDDVAVLNVVGSDEDITGRSLTAGLPGRASRALLTCTTAALTTIESRMNTESIVVQDSFPKRPDWWFEAEETRQCRAQLRGIDQQKLQMFCTDVLGTPSRSYSHWHCCQVPSSRLQCRTMLRR